MRLPLLLALAAAAGVSLPVAHATVTPLPRSTPESQGISSSAIERFVESAGTQVDAIHSFMLLRHGQVVAEGWWAPYAPNEPHAVSSLGKSFTSTAVGLAVAEGRLSIDDPVLKFFPDEAPAQPSANLSAMRVRDLLTMTTGHRYQDIGAFTFTGPDNLVRKFLAMPVPHQPGTVFAYNTPASYVLAAIVQKLTGQTVLEYLKPRLFEPLGIEHPRWETSEQGVSLGGSGLHIKTEDIARFGQLYLQKGQWNGKPLIPAAWVEQATAKQVSSSNETASDWDQGYGFQFWRCRHGFYRGDGALGQYCIVMPQYDAVLAVTGGTRAMGRVMTLAWDVLLPALQDHALPADAAVQARLQERLAHLVLAPVTSSTAPAIELAGRRYALDGEDQLQSVQLHPRVAAGQPMTVTLNGLPESHVVPSGAWQRAPTSAWGSDEDPVAFSGGWTAADTYTLKVCHYRQPFLDTFRFRLAGDQMFVESEQTVGLGDLKPLQRIGRVVR